METVESKMRVCLTDFDSIWASSERVEVIQEIGEVDRATGCAWCTDL